MPYTIFKDHFDGIYNVQSLDFVRPIAYMLQKNCEVYDRNAVENNNSEFFYILNASSLKEDPDSMEYERIFGQEMDNSNDGFVLDGSEADFVVKDGDIIISELHKNVLYLGPDILCFDEDENDEREKRKSIFFSIMRRVFQFLRGEDYDFDKEYINAEAEMQKEAPVRFDDDYQESQWIFLYRVIFDAINAVHGSGKSISAGIYCDPPDEGAQIKLHADYTDNIPNPSDFSKDLNDLKVKIHFNVMSQELYFGAKSQSEDDFVAIKESFSQFLQSVCGLDFQSFVEEKRKENAVHKEGVSRSIIARSNEFINSQIRDLSGSIDNAEREMRSYYLEILKRKRLVYEKKKALLLNRSVLSDLQEKFREPVDRIFELPYLVTFSEREGKIKCVITDIFIEYKEVSYKLGSFSISIDVNSGRTEISNIFNSKKDKTGKTFAHPQIGQGEDAWQLYEAMCDLLGEYEYATALEILVRFLSDVDISDDQAVERLQLWK